MSRPAPIGCRRRKRLQTRATARGVSDAWRDHIEPAGAGLYRIKKHGTMRVDAMLVADEGHLSNQSDQSPGQLANTASMPGIVGMLGPWLIFTLDMDSPSEGLWQRTSIKVE